MIVRVVAWCARRSRLVLALAMGAALAGEVGRRALSPDALPELADPRVAVVAEWMGHSASEVADGVTRALTSALEGVPDQLAVLDEQAQSFHLRSRRRQRRLNERILTGLDRLTDPARPFLVVS